MIRHTNLALGNRLVSMMRNVLLQKSETGEIRLFDSRDKFHACFKNGQWHDRLVFDDYELEEFDLIENDSEIAKALSEARAALGCQHADS
ncbi:hypothetical protein KBI23_26315 [bacterium]|nr:hypothetical protein [bacterium]